MSGVLPGELKQSGLARNSSGLSHVCKARAGNPEESGGPANRSGVHAVLFPRHAVKVIADADVERKTRANLPIVFEEGAPFILVIILNPNGRCEVLIRRAVNIECQAGAGHRTGEV